MKAARPTTISPVLPLIFLWGCVFIMACRLDILAKTWPTSGASIIDRVFGTTRVAMGAHFYMEADRYFHLGVGHKPPHIYKGIFYPWAEAIQPTGHVHPRDREINEILPWLRVATALDPHNVDAFLNAAYWISGQGGRSDLGEAIFLEAQRYNPDDYRIFQEKGLYYVREKKDHQATHALDRAIQLWPSRQDPDDEQTRLDLAQILTIRAFLYEIAGEKEQALGLFKQASSMFPNNQGLAKRVEMLEKGEGSEAAARKTWDSFFPRSQICSREAHQHADHEHEDGHEHEHEQED